MSVGIITVEGVVYVGLGDEIVRSSFFEIGAFCMGVKGLDKVLRSAWQYGFNWNWEFSELGCIHSVQFSVFDGRRLKDEGNVFRAAGVCFTPRNCCTYRPHDE